MDLSVGVVGHIVAQQTFAVLLLSLFHHLAMDFSNN